MNCYLKIMYLQIGLPMEEKVLQSELPVLVDFYADWCGPCKMMGPVVEKCAEAYAGKMKIGKLNVDDNMAIAQKYRVVHSAFHRVQKWRARCNLRRCHVRSRLLPEAGPGAGIT